VHKTPARSSSISRNVWCAVISSSFGGCTTRRHGCPGQRCQEALLDSRDHQRFLFRILSPASFLLDCAERWITLHVPPTAQSSERAYSSAGRVRARAFDFVTGYQ
jgi:hypothetical protein